EVMGGVDILIANAGIQKDAPFLEMTLEEWEKVINVNLTAQFVCVQEAVKIFCKNDPTPSRGKIIFMNSVHQVIPWAGRVNYAASKGGLKLLMESLAQEISHHKIRVNAIAPGAIKTNINKDAWDSPEEEKELIELIPYGRIGDVNDVAKAALWLASDESDYIVGTTLYIDGGMKLYPGFKDGG
ncbi:MAG: SDR family oxidoreductase, partial [Bacteriovoracaceae bacterium]